MLALVADLRRAPDHQLSARVLVAGVQIYQATLSQFYGRMGLRCRFTLSCSHYADACLQRFGALRGSWLAARRVLRCGPWTPQGTVDPPPLS